MKVRDIPTAEVLDDSEKFIDAYVLLIEALIDLEQHSKKLPYIFTDLLDKEAP